MSVVLSAFPGGGLRVPRIGLGTSGFNAQTADESQRIVAAAEERGLSFVDTADVYHQGESECVLGSAIAGRRHRFIVATKCGHRADALGASRRAIRIAVEASLRRLGTDYIDILHLHAPDPITPLEETISTFQDLIREGKVLYYGLSNHASWQIVDAVHVARALNGPAPLSVQSQVNAIALGKHSELLPALQRMNVGLLAASPLARGLLGRQYTMENPPPDDHPLRGRKGYLTWTQENLDIAVRLREVAMAHHCPPARIALALVLSLPMVVSALVRPTRVSDLDDYLAYDGQEPTAAELSYIRRGEPGTPRSHLKLAQ